MAGWAQGELAPPPLSAHLHKPQLIMPHAECGHGHTGMGKRPA
jgi:hypothetical protein